MIGLAVLIERGLILVDLVVDELGRVLDVLVQDVGEGAGLGLLSPSRSFLRGGFELGFACRPYFEFCNHGNRHRESP